MFIVNIQEDFGLINKWLQVEWLVTTKWDNIRGNWNGFESHKFLFPIILEHVDHFEWSRSATWWSVMHFPNFILKIIVSGLVIVDLVNYINLFIELAQLRWFWYRNPKAPSNRGPKYEPQIVGCTIPQVGRIVANCCIFSWLCSTYGCFALLNPPVMSHFRDTENMQVSHQNFFFF